jgi:hypothetical protein
LLFVQRRLQFVSSFDERHRHGIIPAQTITPPTTRSLGKLDFALCGRSLAMPCEKLRQTSHCGGAK